MIRLLDLLFAIAVILMLIPLIRMSLTAFSVIGDATR